MKTIVPRFAGDRSLDSPNYGISYAGFSYRDNNAFSKGIVLFTREEYEGILPSHSFIVTGKDTIVEATFPVVREYPLHKLIDDPHVIVFFKKPRGLDEEKISIIFSQAQSHLGKKYDTSLIASFIYRALFFRVFGRIPYFRRSPSLFDTPSQLICSELLGEVLNCIPEYTNLFPLSELHPSKMTPKDLFRSEIFTGWSFDDNTDS